MVKMKFDVECVRNCLLENGRVFTVRSWQGCLEVESIVEVPNVGMCKKIRIGKIKSKNDIARYVKLSGFDNVDAWMDKINKFHACPGWLFLVVKI